MRLARSVCCRTHTTPRLLLLATLLTGCDGASGSPSGPLFQERSAQAGLSVVLTCGVPGAKQTILEVNGNGVALVDLDGDGDLDVVLTEGSTRARFLAGQPVAHHVFRNDGPLEGVPRFTRVLDHGLVQEGWPTGVTSGDVDRDGRADLVIGGLGQDALFLNRTEPGGELRFERRVLPGRNSPLDWTTSLALADADEDGVLDLYLGRYLLIDPANPPLDHIGDLPCRFKGHAVMCGPHGMQAQPDAYLRGLPGQPDAEADSGSAPARKPEPLFVEATADAGLHVGRPAYGLGVLFQDLDADGHVDLYVANDSVDNFLFRNAGDGRFDNRTLLSGAASDAAGRAQAGMGVAAGDVDRDGDFDLVVTNFSDEANTLYRNDGSMLFRDVSQALGLAHLSRPLLGWGVALADFDADGWLDLFFANGHVYPQADLPDTDTSYAQPLVLLRGRGDGELGRANVFPDERLAVARAIAQGDLDGDGDLDLIVLTLDGAPRLYVNRTDRPERQLLVSLDGGAAHPDVQAPPGSWDAFGATLTLRTDRGQFVSQKVSASGFQGQGDARLHFGDIGQVTSAQVLWPGGQLETLDAEAFKPGHHVHVRRGEGILSTSALEPAP